MNLKYAALGLISGYLAAYILDYLQKQNTDPAQNNTETNLETENN